MRCDLPPDLSATARLPLRVLEPVMTFARLQPFNDTLTEGCMQVSRTEKAAALVNSVIQNYFG